MIKPLTKKEYDRLTPSLLARDNCGRLVWECECACGEVTFASRSALERGDKRSCGCLRREDRDRRFTKHGQSGTGLYWIWCSMKQRCHNPKNHAYPDYGGRGIYVCQRWRTSFDAFACDIGPRPSQKHSLDRIDNDGPYGKENCRWATVKEQSENCRPRQKRSRRRRAKTRAQAGPVNLTGKFPGTRWDVIAYLGDGMWLCRCDCGTEAAVNGSNLRRGLSRQCFRCRGRKADRDKAHAEYGVWKDMRRRCSNPGRKDAHRYVRRGITVCRRWAGSFRKFLTDMGQRPSPRHSLDRVDNNKGYHCGRCEECVQKGWEFNCRWATAIEQCRNKTKTVVVVYRGESLPLAELCDRLALPYRRVYERLRGRPDRGSKPMPLEEAISASFFRARRMVTIRGLTRSLGYWCNRLGHPYMRTWHRMMQGMSFKEAIA